MAFNVIQVFSSWSKWGAKFALALWIFAFTISAYADGLTGAEWTFTNEELVELGRQREMNRASIGAKKHDQVQDKLKSDWFEEVKKRCPECKIVKDGNGFTVSISPNHWFKVSGDPWVLEVTASPMNAKELRQHKDKLADLIWNSAKKVGIAPHSRIGGGHIHLDIKTFFENDRMLFRNFVVDLMNNPELFLGALGFDLVNAPPLALLSAEQRAEFKKLLERFDQSEMTIAEFKKQLSEKVYTKTFYANYPHQRSYPGKYQAVNAMHAETMEVRGLRPEQSIDDHINIVELFERRKEYLKKIDKPIPYVEKDLKALFSARTERSLEFYESKMSREEIEIAARKYVEETGANWDDYQDLLTRGLADHPVQSICSNAYAKLPDMPDMPDMPRQ